MRLDVVPESLPERAALALGLVPSPFAHTHMAPLLARAVMAATKAGCFEILADGPLTAEDVAARCGTHPRATRALLDALVGARYLRRRRDRYALTRFARRWVLKSSPRSLYDSILFRALEWDWMARLDNFVRTGKPVRFHETLSEAEWGLYQRGMRAFARLMVPETARRTPVPKGARDLLDVGGAHGAFSVALCQRHPRLRAVVLDLPEAVAHAASLLAEDAQAAGVAGRVTHRAADALSDDLGDAAFDVVFVAQLAHHFEENVNRALVQRFARALRPGGVLVMQEVIGGGRSQMAGLADLYFALASEAGALGFETMAAWQREAGLRPHRPLRFRTVPGIGQQNATKPG